MRDHAADDPGGPEGAQTRRWPVTVGGLYEFASLVREEALALRLLALGPGAVR